MLRPNSEDGIIRLGTVDSVLTSVRQFASLGCLDPFDSVTAVEQTAGRGQYGRTWQSPAGNIKPHCACRRCRPLRRPQQQRP